jgi:hypothetical protein
LDMFFLFFFLHVGAHICINTQHTQDEQSCTTNRSTVWIRTRVRHRFWVPTFLEALNPFTSLSNIFVASAHRFVSRKGICVCVWGNGDLCLCVCLACALALHAILVLPQVHT